MPVSVEAAQRAVNFFERVLVHIDGEWAGRPFLLMDWQREMIERLFGTLNEDGLRQYRTCYVEIPRKNGKSETAAGIALYLLFADHEEGAQVYGAAGDRDQASIVYRVAAEMVRRSPVLAKRAKVLDSVKRVVVQLVANRVAVVAGRRDVERQRLAPGAGGGVEHVDQVAVRLHVHLIDDDAVGVEAVAACGVGGDRSVEGSRGRDGDPLH